MAFTAKLTIQRGKVDLKNVVLAAGTAEAQSETISVNIDQTLMSKGTAILLLSKLQEYIAANKWPLQ